MGKDREPLHLMIRNLVVRFDQRLKTSSGVAMAAGAIAASLLVFQIAPMFQPLFSVPGNGIGAVSETRYPKSYDYFVVLLLVLSSGVGAICAAALGWRGNDAAPQDRALPGLRSRIVLLTLAVIVVVAMFIAHYHPYQLMDTYHEGESLSPASVMLAGGRPYRDVFFMHGYATDGGLDLLVLGDPPSPLRPRLLKTVLSALTLAMLVPIARELCTTLPGVIASVFLGLFACAAGIVPSFPWFRYAPILLMLWCVLAWLRTRRPGLLLLGSLVATTGLLWSLDTGLYATAGILGWAIGRRLLLFETGTESRVLRTRHGVIVVMLALGSPLLLLVLLGADLRQFALDSFVTLPESFDAIYSLPAPSLPQFGIASINSALQFLASEPVRYYFPLAFYGLLIGLAVRWSARGERRRAEGALLLAITALLMFRTASGRVGWSHIRFALPLFGLGLGAFVFEPLVARLSRGNRWNRGAALAALLSLGVSSFYLVEVQVNATYFAGYVRNFVQRLEPPLELVAFPLRRAGDMYTDPQTAKDLTLLRGLTDSLAPKGAPFFDFSGEKALYYLLERPASTRCHDIPYLSNPRLQSEAMRQLEIRPPAFVVIEGLDVLANIDQVSNRTRVPVIAAWVDRNYPVRFQAGRFLVGFPPVSRF